MTRVTLLACSLLALAVPAVAGVFETTEHHGQIAKTILIWRAGADSTLTDYTTTRQFRGVVLLVRTEPDTSASTYALDSLYVRLKDSRGTDILGGAGANRDSICAEVCAPLLPSGTEWPVPATGKLTLSITHGTATENLGGLARGRVEIYELEAK
jgi:hypothetical protein